MLQVANLGLRFMLELCALAGLGYWGATSGRGPLTKTLLGIGAPLAAAVIWGAFVAPKASVPVSEPIRLLLEVLVFGSAVVALYRAGRPTLALVFAAAVVINRVLMMVWNQ